jgi:energy-coupling factor transporter transmembrane protein EcfT
MGAIAIITTSLVFLLIVGLVGIIISTLFLIFALFKKKIKLFKIIPIVGIVLFLVPFAISIIGIYYFRNMIKEDETSIVDTGVKLYWEYEKNNEENEYFIYNGKKYILLTSLVYDKPKSREIDKPVANIVEREDNVISKLFMLVFGINERTNILYTIKGYPDDTLLMEDSFGSVYCDENTYFEKNYYYEDINNYKYYATYGHLPDEYDCVELYNRNIIKEIYIFLSSGNLLQPPSENECNYIFIFGISNDGILLKDLASIILYENQIYKEFGYFSEDEDEGMAILIEKQSEYINRIIIENNW